MAFISLFYGERGPGQAELHCSVLRLRGAMDFMVVCRQLLGLLGLLRTPSAQSMADNTGDESRTSIIRIKMQLPYQQTDRKQCPGACNRSSFSHSKKKPKLLNNDHRKYELSVFSYRDIGSRITDGSFDFWLLITVANPNGLHSPQDHLLWWVLCSWRFRSHLLICWE